MYKDLNEAEDAKIDLIARIQDIDTQLSHGAAKSKVGRQPTADYKKYMEWKASAMFARKELNKKLQETKLWIRRQQTKQADVAKNNKKEAKTLLNELFVLVTDLIANGAELTRDEKALIVEIEAFLTDK